MAKYFSIQSGLRGCYMPDSSAVIRVETRRELKAHIKSEAHLWEGAAGLSKRAIAAFAALAWREAGKRNPSYLPHCLPIKPEGCSDYSSGIFASVITRAEFLELMEESDFYNQLSVD